MPITARIVQVTRPPDPSRVPYPDAVVSIHLTGVQGLPGGATEIVVRALGLAGRRLTAAAALAAGATFEYEVVPWAAVEAAFGGLNRIELDDPDFTLIDLPVYWWHAGG